MNEMFECRISKKETCEQKSSLALYKAEKRPKECTLTAGKAYFIIKKRSKTVHGATANVTLLNSRIIKLINDDACLSKMRV